LPRGLIPPAASQRIGRMVDDQAPEAASPDDATIDFNTFVAGLITNARMHLGAEPHPDTGAEAQDMALARQTIDILGMLSEKTLGNLTEPERDFLQAALYDLHMSFLDCCQGAEEA
jgi:hypothetical protein